MDLGPTQPICTVARHDLKGLTQPKAEVYHHYTDSAHGYSFQPFLHDNPQIPREELIETSLGYLGVSWDQKL